jgi:hypothetical protein
MAQAGRYPSRRFFPPGEGARKIISRFIPRNPLKSLDSDERIQENPRKSKPINSGFRSETA